MSAEADSGSTEKVWVGGEDMQVGTAASAQVIPSFDFEGGAAANRFSLEDLRHSVKRLDSTRNIINYMGMFTSPPNCFKVMSIFFSLYRYG